MSEDKCQDKLAYETQQEAEGAKVAAHYRYSSNNLKSYKCRDCELWHLATSD